MIRFRPDGHPCGCCFADAITAILSFLDPAAAGGGEIAAGIPGAISVTPEVAGLGAAGAGTAAAAAPAIATAAGAPEQVLIQAAAPTIAGATGAETALTPAAIAAGALLPQPVTQAPLAPPPNVPSGPFNLPTTSPLATPTAPLHGSMGASPGGASAGGGAASAGGTAAPTSVGVPSPDVTQGIGTAATQTGGGSLPGNVGNGAAAGSAGSLPGTVNAGPLSVPSVTGADVSPLTPPNMSTLDKVLSGAGDVAGKVGSFAANNPLNVLTAGIMGFDALKGLQPPKYASNLAGAAATDAAQASKLESFINTEQLPPGMMASVNQAANAASASIKARYAAQGMTGSSAEAEDLENLQQRVQGQIADTALQLFQQGVGESQMSTQLYSALMGNALAQDQEVAGAVGNLALALSGGGRALQPASAGSV